MDPLGTSFPKPCDKRVSYNLMTSPFIEDTDDKMILPGVGGSQVLLRLCLPCLPCRRAVNVLLSALFILHGGRRIEWDRECDGDC